MPPDPDSPAAARPPQFSVRHLMILVAFSGIGLGSALAVLRRHEVFRRLSGEHFRAGSSLLLRYELPYDTPPQFSRHDRETGLRTRGPEISRAFRRAQYHWELGEKYREASDRPWLPVLPDPTEPE